MKTILFTLMALTITVYVDAQSNNTNSRQAVTGTKDESQPATGVPSTSIKKNPIAIAGKKKYAPGIFSTSEWIVGHTDYDLQTNGSIYPRIVNHLNGTVSATWTIIPDGAASASRGTGYNYFDGNA